MSNQAKLLISLLVVAFDIGLVMYVFASFASDPAIIIAVAVFMVISSIHVVMIIWFGEKWYSTPELRLFLQRLTGRAN